MDKGRDSDRLVILADKFRDKLYRDSYIASHTRGILAQQVRNFRGELSQAEYAEKIGKQKTVVGRLENPGYGGWSLRTMLEIARKENVAVLVRFVDFPTFLEFSNDFSEKALRPSVYDPNCWFKLTCLETAIDPKRDFEEYVKGSVRRYWEDR